MHKEQVVILAQIMTKQNITNKFIWDHILQEIVLQMETKNINLPELHMVIKSQFQTEIFNENIANSYINYFVDKGYDSDDLV